MSEPFGGMLRRLRIEAGLSQNALAAAAGVDAAYLNRLERAGQHRRDGSLIQQSIPRRTVLCAFARVLGLGQGDTDRLLYAAGLAPATDWQTRAERAEHALESVRAALWTEDDLTAFVRRQTG